MSKSMNVALRRAWLAGAVLLVGCATAPTDDPADPLEPYNRGMTTVNRGLDRAVLKPVATGYRKAVPEPVRTGVSNFFANLGDAWSALNSALQLKLRNAGENAGRFAINTVFGIAGVFDIASRMNIDRHKEDFGTTLGHWGVPPGPYLVLPLLGPSTVRDTFALPVDLLGNPIRTVTPAADRNAIVATRGVDGRAALLAADPAIDASPDPYLFIRDAWLQHRQWQIDGTSDVPQSRAADDPGPTPAVQ
jgi:phospholipid-binding lipoprotein MlaA